jgi:hypothetical protein
MTYNIYQYIEILNMNTKNILTEEIVRIMEIMGVSADSSSIITESIVDDLISGGIKVLGDSSDATKFTKKIGDEYGIPVNSSEIKKQIDEFVKTTNPTRKQQIFIELIDEMNIEGIKKLSNQLLDTTKVQKIINDEIDIIQKSIDSGNFTLSSGELDYNSIYRYINDEIDVQIKTSNSKLQRLADTLKQQIKNRISKSTGSKVGTTSTGNVKTFEQVDLELRMKINNGRKWSKIQQDNIDEFKKVFDPSKPENVEILSNGLKTMKDASEKGDPKALESLKNFRKYASEILGMSKNTIDGLIDSGYKALSPLTSKKVLIIGFVFVLSGGLYYFRDEFNKFKSGTHSEGSKLYCWTQNVASFGILDSNEQNYLSDATGITCDDFESGDDSKIPKMVKKLTSKNTGKLYYVITYKDDRIERYDENFRKITTKKSEDEINTSTEKSKITTPSNEDELLNRFEIEVKEGWGDAITGEETYRRDDNLFIVNDGDKDYTYKYENGIFKPLNTEE